MHGDSSTKDRRRAWPQSRARARRRIGALGSGILLSIACGGNADPSATTQGSTSQTCGRIVKCLDQPQEQAECEEELRALVAPERAPRCGFEGTTIALGPDDR